MKRGGRWSGTVQITLPRLHLGQRRVAEEAGRFNVIACGRRWGKTTLLVDRLIQLAISGQPVAWFAPTYKNLGEVWRVLRSRLAPAIAATCTAERRLELVTGGSIECWSLEAPDTIRGRKYAAAAIDEAAQVRDLAYCWHQVIRPTLADLQGGAWIASTPRGRGLFWELFARGQQPDDAYRSWQMPTASNPHIGGAELVGLQAELPERVWRQEFLAEFLDDDALVFRGIRAAVAASEQPQALADHSYVMGVDWGRQNDYTAFVVIDTTLQAVAHVGRVNRVDYALQLGMLRGLYERFQVQTVLAEQNSIGVPLIEQLQRQGLPVVPFVTSNASKQHLIDGLALALEQGRLALPDSPLLLAELEAFGMERLPSGLLRYGAPAGQHDDLVIALALAWQAAEECDRPLLLW